MRGLLSTSIPLAGLLAAQQAVPAPVQAPPPVPLQPSRPRVSGWRVLDRVLGGQTITDAYDAERMRPMREAQMQLRMDAQNGLLGLLNPAPESPQAAPVQSSGGQPSRASNRSLPSLRTAGPALAAAQLAGIEGVDGLIGLLDKAGPDLAEVNGVIYDRNDPGNVGQRIGVNLSNVNGTLSDLQDPNNAGRFIPEIPEGAMPLYDQNGNVVAIRNLDGAVQALGERERATNDARNASTASYAAAISGAESAGSAPYEFVSVPTASGAPAVISRAQAANGAFTGQTPADAIRQAGAANREVARDDTLEARYRSGQRQLPILAEMERNLEGAITGFAAGPRLAGARVLEFLGNDSAGQAVQASQVFEQQAGRIVQEIIKTFGANPTEGERAYLEKISGANRDLSPRTLQEGIRLARESIRRDEQAYRNSGSSQSGQPQQGVSRDAAIAELRRRGRI